jgi:hypothetical protein
MSPRVRRLGSVAVLTGAIVGVVICVWFGIRTLALDLPVVQASFPAAPYALDGQRGLVVAAVVEQGANPYTVAGFFYPPLGALLMAPFSAFGPDLGLWAWFLLKVALLVWCVGDATRGFPWAAGALAGLLVLTSTYVFDDLWLGNVSILIAAAIYLAISRDRPLAAIPLGVVIALVAKPFLLPFLLWLLVFRRRSAISALATAGAASLLGILVFGPGAYRAYLETLTTATRLDLSWSAGLSGIAPQLLVPVSVAVLVIFVILLWKSRDESSLLVWSLLIGLIAAPYIGHYSVVPVLAGIPAFARDHPSRSLLLAAIAAPVSLVAIVGAAFLGLVITFPSDVLRRFGSAQTTPALET